ISLSFATPSTVHSFRCLRESSKMCHRSRFSLKMKQSYVFISYCITLPISSPLTRLFFLLLYFSRSVRRKVMKVYFYKQTTTTRVTTLASKTEDI
ncbi:hypothetical protein PENTCL1PPCAC_9522, partial [Pristionchus entomophagus]